MIDNLSMVIAPWLWAVCSEGHCRWHPTAEWSDPWWLIWLQSRACQKWHHLQSAKDKMHRVTHKNSSESRNVAVNASVLVGVCVSTWLIMFTVFCSRRAAVFLSLLILGSSASWWIFSSADSLNNTWPHKQHKRGRVGIQDYEWLVFFVGSI